MRFLVNFFQEEFDKPDDPLRSSQKRDTVSVKKIHATFGKLAAGELDRRRSGTLAHRASSKLRVCSRGISTYHGNVWGKSPSV